MTDRKMENKVNPYIEALKKNFGREIVVVVDTSKGVKRIKGVCEAIDFIHKNIIIRNDKNTYSFKHYLWIERPRPIRDDGKKKKVASKKK